MTIFLRGPLVIIGVYFLIVNTAFNIAFAQTMSNTQFKIKWGNLNMAAGDVSNFQYKLNESVGQTAPGLYTGTNYKVRAGFEYFKQGNLPFSFSLSTNTVDFGVITPTNPLTRTVILTISSGSSKGFTVSSSENHPLASQNGTIPDVSCDNGDCNTTKASLWSSSLTYGFGYRCDPTSSSGQANVCSADFSNPDFYKPFAASPSAQNILSSTTGGSGRKSQVTYKVNVSGSQPQGVYTNIVTYIASPGF